MAGRGRGATLPAWMTDGVGAQGGGGGRGKTATLPSWMTEDRDYKEDVSQAPPPPPPSQDFSSYAAPIAQAPPSYAPPPPRHPQPPPPSSSGYEPRGGGSGGSGGYGRGRSSRGKLQNSDGTMYDPATRKYTNWDVRPDALADGQGYPENYGLGVLSQVSRKDTGDRPRGGSGMMGFGNGFGGNYDNAPRSGGGGGGGGASAMDKNQRKVYVGNIPHGISQQELIGFFDETFQRCLDPNALREMAGPSGRPILECFVASGDKNYAFVEMTTLDGAATLLQLDNVQLFKFNLRMKRPKAFDPNGPVGRAFPIDAAAIGLTDVTSGGPRIDADGIATQVPDGPNKVFIGGIPHHLMDEQVKELLLTFGQLRAFNLVKEPGRTDRSKGFAFCEYLDPSATNTAVCGLNGLQIGDKTLTVTFAGAGRSGGGGAPPAAQAPVPDISGMGAVDAAQAALAGAFGGGSFAYGGGNAYAQPPQAPPPPVAVPPPVGGPVSMKDRITKLQSTLASKLPTRVIKLTDMVSSDEVNDDNEYRDIALDVRQECSTYGSVLSVIIPRVKEGYDGLLQGHIYVEFASPTEAHEAAMKLCGRKFGDQLVVADFLDEQTYSDWKQRFGVVA